jgi:hypothetical protein
MFPQQYRDFEDVDSEDSSSEDLSRYDLGCEEHFYYLETRMKDRFSKKHPENKGYFFSLLKSGCVY